MLGLVKAYQFVMGKPKDSRADQGKHLCVREMLTGSCARRRKTGDNKCPHIHDATDRRPTDKEKASIYNDAVRRWEQDELDIDPPDFD